MKGDSFFSPESPSGLHKTLRLRKSLAPLLSPAYKPQSDDDAILTKRLNELAFDINFGKDMPEFRSRPSLSPVPPAPLTSAHGVSLNDEIGKSHTPPQRWCRRCYSQVEATVSFEATPKTFLASVAIFLTGGVFGCFLAPYCSDACKEARMHCSHCGGPV